MLTLFITIYIKNWINEWDKAYCDRKDNSICISDDKLTFNSTRLVCFAVCNDSVMTYTVIWWIKMYNRLGIFGTI